jgi:hypothetical protein
LPIKLTIDGFLPLGLEDIVTSRDNKGDRKRRIFQPLALQTSDRAEKLGWLQQKKMSEAVLKNAIAGNEVS